MPPQRRALQEISGNIRNTYKLTSDQRIAIITKYNDGYTPKELADEFRVTTKCIYNTIRRWRIHHTTQDLPRLGRLKKLSARDIRQLKRCARKTPKIHYKSLLEKAGFISRILRTTIYRRIKEQGLTKCKYKRRPFITGKIAQKRLIWVRQWRNFNWRQRTVRFSDECSIQIGSNPTREWAFRYQNEK